MEMHVYMADGAYLGATNDELKPGNKLVKSGKFVEVVSVRDGSTPEQGRIVIVKSVA